DFCKKTGQLSGNGTQIKSGFCSSTPQGSIPTVDNMVSTIIVSPANAAVVDAAKDLVVKIDTLNLETGFFDLAASQYYIVPQTLNKQGQIQGHQHITIQPLQTTSSAPDPKVFAFFKGLNDRAPDGRTLQVTVPAGTLTQNGLFRICSITGSDGHAPAIMPVAQRGSQDDCIRISV
ncbi:hypothetical protein BDK51DRAFT_3463, partial [Blyttiomyces helicus]